MRSPRVRAAGLSAVSLAALAAGVYFFAPQRLLALLRSALRRHARLTRKVQYVDGQPWPYLEGGPADGEPVVLLHGFGGDKDNWPIYARRLTDRFLVVAPDLPGFGENSREIGVDYGTVAQAERVRDFLDALQIETCHLGGSSMGGFIALRFAIDFPERLRSLTLFNNAGVLGVTESELQRSIEAGENTLAIESVDDVNRLVAFVAHDAPRVPRQFCKIIHDEFAEHRELLDAIFWQVANEATREPLNERLSEVAAPTLIVWGRHDRLIDVSCVDVLADGIRDAEKAVLENVGHAPMVERPTKTAAAHRSFLARHTG
jgi:pimeloyl-ACP methyl ester carboxylesterase